MEISNAENINQVKSILKNAHRVLILTGAGTSAESGVPTFRGGGGAPVWRGMPFEQLSSAQMVEKDLPLVWEWFDYRRGKVSECEPNAAHITLAKVQQSDHFEELVIVTQNIDGLHQAAGAKSVIELHGSIWQARCLSCKTKQDLRDIPADERPPVCPECFDSMRPDVILFGEAMPMEAVYVAQQKAEKADVCFVIGTSALVYPAAGLSLIAKQNGAKIIEINPEETSLSAIADLSLRGKAGKILPLIFAEDNPGNPRLPDEKAIKNSVEQNRKESKSGDNLKTSVPEVSSAKRDPKNNLMNSQSHPLRVDFIASEEFPVLEKMGMTFAPGKKQSGAVSGNWNRDLATDLSRLRDFYHADTLVSLVEDEELDALGISDLEYECRNHNVKLIRFPLRDVSVPPSLKEFAGLIREVIKHLNEKKTIVIHCKGGLGRAGLTASCAVIAASENKISPLKAIKIVRGARKGTVETAEQERFVSLFGEYWKLYIQQINDLLRQQKTAAKERVLQIACEGGGVNLYRFKTRDGKWLFCTEGSGISMDENDFDETISWETEPVESISEGINSFRLAEQIFIFHPRFVHAEYRAEVKDYLEHLHAHITDEQRQNLQQFASHASVTPDTWLAEADRKMTWKAESADFDNNERGKSDGVREEVVQDHEELSDNHFLVCWKEQSVIAAQNSPQPLDVVSSRQLNRVNAGNTIWIVFVNQDGKLILAGRLKAAEVVDYLTAVRRLHDANLWDGDYYALAAEDAAEKINLINLGERALELRFKKSGSDRLTATNGKIRAQQLGSMRELTAESAALLTEIWENAAFDFGDKDFDDEDFDGETFSDDESDGDDYNFPDAIDVEIFEDIARREPLNAEAHYNVGVVRSQTGDLEGARQAYRRTVELDPAYFAAWYNLGADHLDAGEWREGVECFDKAIAAKPDFAIAYFMKGAACDRLDNHIEAIRLTRKGLEFAPDDAQAYHNIGYSYQRLGEYEKAIESFEKALQLAPDDARTFYKLGKCYRELGEREKEFDAYRKAVEIAPDFLDALFALGTVYAHVTETVEGERVTYFETGGGKLELKYLRLFYYYMGLASLALGNLDNARTRQVNLRETDEHLADQLQFFIDRYVPDGESENDNDSEEFDLQWLEPGESGFDIRVLDCRPFTETRVSFAAEEQNALTFVSTRDADGEHHRGKSPESTRSFSCDLYYPINALIYSHISDRTLETRDLPEGKLFSAAEMEEKWDVYYFDKYFYFVRSWTDKIAYRARAEEQGLYLSITEIEYDGENEQEKDYHLRAVDFLLKTFVIGLTVPHPVSPDIENNPESIALFSFSFAGKQAKFASFEDTISAIPTLQAMDYVGPFDKEKEPIREYEEQKESKATTAASKKRELIEIFIDGQSFEAKNIPQLYKAVLQYLVDTGKLENVSIPVSTGDKRYILAKEPVHPTGKSFLASVEYGGFFMEAHNNRTAAIAQLRKLIESANCTFGENINFDPGMDDEPEELNLDAEKLKKFQGCLLGGAVGDALGAAIEFDSIASIRHKFGEQGLTDYAPAYGRIGAITDDTQMTLFTAEGLLRGESRHMDRGNYSMIMVIYFAYMRWLETQGIKLNDYDLKSFVYDIPSWLRDLPELNSRRAPGNSCLSALQSGKAGTIEEPINNSKGCGGVMRVAPIGLVALNPFDLACEAAAITHGHPTGYLSAGVLALIISQIIEGKSLMRAINHAVYDILPQHANHEETFAACDKAVKLANDKTVLPTPEVIEMLGGGWIAEEALAISIYCSLVYPNDFKKSVLLAVNHSGDSDSTGAITGNILGAVHGLNAVPEKWLAPLELKNSISEIAEDLLIGFRNGDEWWNKYPGV